MAAKLRLTPNQRGEALFLLDKGYSVDQAARALHEIHHSKLPLEVVRKAYFPPNAHGPIAIQNMQGKLSGEIARRYFKLRKFLKSRSKWMETLNKNPQVKSRAIQGMKRFWKNPQSVGAREAAKKRAEMRLEDPVFFAKVVEALQRANNDPKFRALAAQRARGISPRLWKTATLS